MKRLLWISVISILALILAAGCTTVQKGAAVGGLIGAAAGGTLASNHGILSAGEGALVGGAGGGLAGALIGDQLEDHIEEDLQAEIDNLNRQIAELEQKLEKTSEVADRGGEKDQVIDGLKRLTEKQSSELQELKDRLNQKENELTNIQNLRTQKEKDLDELKKELDALQVQLAQTPKGLNLTMVDSLLFTPGQAEITDKGKLLLDQVADILKEKFPNRALVFEGHTDNVPIQMSGWKSNWELGAARALAVLHYLENNHGFDQKRLSATSYGEFRPVATNETEEGRAQNRRAVIVVLPKVDIVHEKYAG